MNAELRIKNVEIKDSAKLIRDAMLGFALILHSAFYILN